MSTVMEGYDFYAGLSKKIRKTILDTVHRTGSPHIGPSFSIVEVLTALYFKFLKNSPETSDDPGRDRFILSKGHACPALYAALAERGFIPRSDLERFAVNGGVFEQHPNICLGHGIELSTGSLGHGLSVGAGMALAGKASGKKYNVYVMLGDGELNEGSVWEAVMFAAHHRLSNLIALVDCNRIQALGSTKDILDLDPLAEKWRSFGWDAVEIDGHAFDQIFRALGRGDSGRPRVVILHTVKGKGVSFMENEILWHYRPPDENEYKLAMKELDT